MNDDSLFFCGIESNDKTGGFIEALKEYSNNCIAAT